MAMSAGRDDGLPMVEMNTTPLIDVMLVLLIMIIITIPMQTHAVKINLPSGIVELGPDPVVNKLAIDAAGTVRWNDAPIDLVTLGRYLGRTRAMQPEPELHVRPDPDARYDAVDRVLAVVKASEVTKMGFIDNEKYRVFGK